MGPSVGPPISKRGRISGRSGDLLGTRPLDKVGRSLLRQICIFFPHLIYSEQINADKCLYKKKKNPPKKKKALNRNDLHVEYLMPPCIVCNFWVEALWVILLISQSVKFLKSSVILNCHLLFNEKAPPGLDISWDCSTQLAECEEYLVKCTASFIFLFPSISKGIISPL